MIKLKVFRQIIAAAAVTLLAAAALFAQRDMAIAAVQGDKNMSPVEMQTVRVTGIVTARIRTGFFLQSPDDKTDGNPATSEGIFVFTRTEPDFRARVGSLVIVTGKVEEFRRNNEPASLTVTNIIFGTISVVSTGNPLPKPMTLAVDDFKPNEIDQLERFEGMRVRVQELRVISPTDGRVNIKTASAESNGSFYGVLNAFVRPFREPGFDIAEYLFLDDKTKAKLRSDHPKMQLFDTNPERLRIESSYQDGAKPLEVITGSVMDDLTGVLHYSYRVNTILVDPGYNPAIRAGVKPNPMPALNDREFSVVGMNIENFFDDKDDPAFDEDVVEPQAFQNRLNKISLAFVNVLRLPDLVGIVEAESLNSLKSLAAQVNKDAVAAGLPDPKYEAYLSDGNDGRGIDNGYLVKSTRVKVVEVKQLGKAEKYKHPTTKEEMFLNDRTPLMIRVSINDAKSGKPFELTAIVNHMKSYSGYNDPRQMENVRLKKRLQAEYLAKIVQERQKADPNERVVLLGDFNSYQFGDGIMDMMGTIKGMPAGTDSTIFASDDLVTPDLTNLVELIAERERYSYIFDGNAQVLDHILINEPLTDFVKGFGFARVNADYPESFRNDPKRAERFSDHDPAVAYFRLDAAR